jgi:hypothetical protein
MLKKKLVQIQVKINATSRKNMHLLRQANLPAIKKDLSIKRY